MTGDDFELIRDPARGNRITGVFSKSEKESLKKTGFPEQYQEFENKKAYNEWKFVCALTSAPGQAGAALHLPGSPPAPTSTK